MLLKTLSETGFSNGAFVATIRDVARESSVSPSTVSRVFNQPDLVREVTRARVLDVAQRLNFVPDAVARALVTGRSGLVGLVVPDITNPFFAYLARGCEDELRRNLLTVALCNSEEQGAEEFHIRQILIARSVEGFIYASAPAVRSTMSEDRDREPAPTVYVERLADGPRIDAVFLDDADGARQVAEHLLTLGHREIAMLAGLPDTFPGQMRLQAFRDSLAVHGCSLPEKNVWFGDFKLESGRAAADELHLRRPRPTAIFAASDPMAYGLIGRLTELGVRVPDEVSVVGFDDLPMSALLHPPLTTVRSPIYELGVQAARLLVERLAQPSLPSRQHTLPVRLAVRGSSGPPPE